MSSDVSWDLVIKGLQATIKPEEFNAWITSLSYKENDKTTITLAVPSPFFKDYILRSYKDVILKQVNLQLSTILNLNIVIDSQTSFTKQQNHEGDEVANKAKQRVLTEEDVYTKTSLPLVSDYTFDKFVVGKPNELAFVAAQRIADLSYNIKDKPNPLFFHGGVGLGKTHLMNSIVWEVKRQDPSKKILYLSSEIFVNLYINSLKSKTSDDFKTLFRSADFLMIDDFQFILGKEQTQEEFFHTFNSLKTANKQIIISADRDPSELEGMNDRLSSRLRNGLVVNILKTTYELRYGILESKARDYNKVIDKDIIDYLAHTITSNIRDLEGALKRLITTADLLNTEITLEMAHESLRDILKRQHVAVSPDVIQKKVAEFYNIKIADLISGKRARIYLKPRQVAIYIVHCLTGLSYQEIGKIFGGRDHTTIMHSVKKVKLDIIKDKAIDDEINLIIKIINSIY